MNILSQIKKYHGELWYRGSQIEASKAKDDLTANITRRMLEDLAKVSREVVRGDNHFSLYFDLDGVLIKAGLETPANPETLSEYVHRHAELIQGFKKEIRALVKLGFKIRINTGRGVDFSRRLLIALFPVNSVDKIICEGGAMILSYERKGKKMMESKVVPSSLDLRSIDLLESSKIDLISYATNKLGAKLENGKEMIISLNPRSDEDIKDFYTKMKKYLEDKQLSDYLEITYSATAVDITPLGADKIKALLETLGGYYAVCFGDAKSDEDAIRAAVISIAPGNALPSTKETAKKCVIGILPHEHELKGVVEALRVIKKVYKLSHIFH